jgi:hypothetical protein
MNKLKEEIDKRYGSFELSNEKNKIIVNNIEEFTTNIAIKFHKWAFQYVKLNESDKTTKELFKEFIENHYKKS